MLMRYCTALILNFILIVLFGTAQANPDVLDKFHKFNTRADSELIYDLYIMGDDKISFLINRIADEDHKVPENAFYMLENYFPDARALSALSVLFLQDTDNWAREKIANLMAHIDGEYTKRFMVKHLHADPETQKIAIDVLTKLKDERVIPFLIQIMENPGTLPERKRFAIYGLADFKDKRVVPVMLETLKSHANIDKDILKEFIEKLAQIDDERTVPILLSVLNINTDIGRRLYQTHSDVVINALSQAGEASIQKVLDKAQTTVPDRLYQSLLKVLRAAKDPKLVPIFEKVCLKTGDAVLKSALVTGMKNMGTDGLNALLTIAKQKPCKELLHSLASYNSVDAIAAVASIALDDSSPLRIDAIVALTSFGSYWNHEVSKYIPKLLEDPNPNVRLSTIDLTRKMELKKMVPVLEQLTQNSKGNTKYAAYTALDYLLDKTPLELKIEMNQKKYDYGEPIALSYSIKNVSDHPIRIGYRKTLSSSYLKLKIQQPDNTLAKYQGKWDRFRYASNRPDDIEYWLAMDDGKELILPSVKSDHYDILQPNEIISGIISVTEGYRLYQSGRYSVHLKIYLSPWKPTRKTEEPVYTKRPPLGQKIKLNFLAWEKMLISPKVHFDIADPTPEQFNTMLAVIDPEKINITDRTQVAHIGLQLGELRKPAALTSLRILNSMDYGMFNPSDKIVMNAIHQALLKYNQPELVKLWIEMLDKHKPDSEITLSIIKKLGASGNEQAIEPIKRIFFQVLNTEASIKAANALKQLGDESGHNWLKNEAYRNIQHWDLKKRVKGAIMLTLLNTSDKNQWRLPVMVRDQFDMVELYDRFSIRNPHYFSHIDKRISLKIPWYFVEDYHPSINWSDIREKTETIDGLKELLKHHDPIIQRAAAYDLAHLRDVSGINLIESDLHAEDMETRKHARETLIILSSEQ